MSALNAYKPQYDSIPIPARLDAAVAHGLHRGRLRRMGRLTSTGLAAVLALVLLAANIPPLSAVATEIPVLGQLIRIMQVGSGGSQSTQVHMDICAEADSLFLEFDAPVPAYSVVRHSSPERLVLRIHGLADPKPEWAAEALASHSGLAQVYPMACTEPNTLALVLESAARQTAVLSQYEAHLQLDFDQTEPTAQATAYRLVSKPMDYGPELAHLTEDLLWEGATQVRLPDGRYQVVLGSYPTLERAQLAQTGIQKHTGVLLTPVLIL